MLPIPDALAGSPAGGDEGNRTLDPLLAGQVLSQLSYTPIRDLLLRCSVIFRNHCLLTTVEVFCRFRLCRNGDSGSRQGIKLLVKKAKLF